MFEQKEECDIYTFNGVGNFIEDDEISASEEGFMRGYLNAAQGVL